MIKTQTVDTDSDWLIVRVQSSEFKSPVRDDSSQAGDEARSAESLQNKIVKNQSAEGTTEKTSVVPSALFISLWS